MTIRLGLESPTILSCSVIDTGIGISSDLCKKLFAPYVRGADPIGINKSGAGFGLSITKRLCERLGGHITVSSVSGKGSTFIFTLPINGEQIHRSAHKRTENGSIMTNTGLLSQNGSISVASEEKKAVRVLCVDDTPMVSYVLEEMLTRLKIKCDIVI